MTIKPNSLPKSGRTKEEEDRRKAQQQNAAAKKKKAQKNTSAKKKKKDDRKTESVKALGLRLPSVYDSLPTLSKEDQKTAVEQMRSRMDTAEKRTAEKPNYRKNTNDKRYNPLIRSATPLVRDSSPEIDNLAEAAVRKGAQGVEGALVGYSDRRNMKRAEDLLSGEYNNRFVPGVKGGLRMQVDDPLQKQRAEAEAKKAGFDSVEDWEMAKANELIHANDDFYERKKVLDKKIELENYQGIKKYIPELAEQIGSMVPTMVVGAVGGGLGAAAGLSTGAAWALNTVLTGGEINGRVSGSEAREVYGALAKNYGMPMNREQMLDAIQKANTAGELVGLAEAGTEALFGGLPFVGKGIANIAAAKVGWEVLSPATKKSIQTWRNTTTGRIFTQVAERTSGAIGEGVEEAIMTLAQPAIENAVAGLESDVTLNDILHDFGMGAAVSLVLGIPVSAVETTSAAVDAIQARDAKNEVISAFENRFHNLVSEGQMTPEQAKTSVQEVKDILSGKGSLRVNETQPESKTDSDTKEVYTDLTKAKEALESKAKGREVGEEVSVAVVENGVAETWKATVTENGIEKMQLGTTTEEEQQAYLNKARKMETATNEAERTGYQLNVKDEIVKEVSALSRALGKDIEFVSTDGAVHGYVDEAGKISVNINSSESPARAVITHEMTHLLENTESYEKLMDLVTENYGSSLDSKREEIKENYEAAGHPLEDSEVDYELMAHFVEEKLLTDKATVQKLLQKDRSIGQKILDWINNIIQKITGSREQEFLMEARDVWRKALAENKKAPKNGAEKRFSFGGEKALTADKGALETAKGMRAEGKDPEEIYRETGWFVGADGKWRFEISNNDLELKIAGFITRQDTVVDLGDVIESKKLFSAYPDLAWLTVEFRDIKNGYAGSYSPNNDSIEIAYDTFFMDREIFKDVLVHEIQHAIQRRESFARGSSEEYWKKQIENGFDSRRKEDIEEEERLQKEYDKYRENNYDLFRDVTELEASTPNVPRGAIDWDTLEQIEEDPVEWQEYDARREKLEEKYGRNAFLDLKEIIRELNNVRKRERTPKELYRSTAGEIEADAAAYRRNLTEAQRRDRFPMNRFEYRDVVFADRKGKAFSTKKSNTKFSIGRSKDAAYLDAVNRGDMAEAQRMVDEAAKAAGYNLKAYHGTNAEFTVFDKDRIGKGVDQYGSGFYFGNTTDIANRYGERVYNTYLKIKNPLEIDGNENYSDSAEITEEEAYRVMTRHPELNGNEDGYSFLGDWFDEYWEVGAQDWMLWDLAERYTSLAYLEGDIFDGYPNEFHDAVNAATGFDGVKVTFSNKDYDFDTNTWKDNENVFYVAWFPEQIKSADPVTYDDEGNVIPLSERFNESNDDIRWSIGRSYRATYKKGDRFHWLGKPVIVEKVIKESGVPDTYILRYDDDSKDIVKGDELISDEDAAKMNAGSQNPFVLDNEIVEYYVGQRVTLGFGEKGYISDKYRMNNNEYAYTVNLDNGEVMEHVTDEDIDNRFRDVRIADVSPKPQTKAQEKIARNYLVGDMVSYLNERATIVERSFPKGGTLSYTIELENGDHLQVGADQLEVGVTTEFRFDELSEETQDEWQNAPDDWDGAYDDLDDLGEPPGDPAKISPLELDEVRHMLSDYSDMLSDPTEEEIEFEWAWTKKLTGRGVSFLKDYVRNIEAAANGNKNLEQRLRKLFIEPFRKGKAGYVSGVHTMLDELYDKMEELGIKKESPESAAIIKFGEKKVITWKQMLDPYDLTKKKMVPIVNPYTLEDLKKEFPDTWENIVEADRWMRDKYDKYLVAINEVRREIYGHHFKHREMEISTAKEKEKQHKETRHELEKQLYDIDHCLRAKRTQLAVKRNNKDAAVADLEREIDYNTTYRNTIENLIAEHKEKEIHYEQVAKELEYDLLHGDSWNQKRLKARENYYHHMREESGFLEDLFMNGRNSEIDPTLEGKSVGTKPKAKWSGIFEKQGRDPFKYCAVSAMIDYIQAAEYAIHMDPVISQFRSDIQNMALATQESRNCNKLILWLTNWTNDLSGKTTDHIDRFVQERIGRDNMRKIRKIVSRSKFNAVGLNLNSAIAQFGNLPNALAFVQHPQSWGKGLQLYAKWLVHDDDARMITKQSTFLDERFLDTVMSKFDQRLKDKPEKFASWALRFGDQHSSFMIWCVAYEDAVRRGLENPATVADEITMKAVAGRGVGEIPLQMRSTWTQIIAPFQIEVNNAYQIYKNKSKTLLDKKSTKGERINAGTSFLILLLGNFVANTISDLLAHRRILFDPIYVLLETIGEWADEDDDEKTNWSERFRDLFGREVGNLFSNMPYGDLIAYYVFNNEWAREKLFGDYDPTRFGVGNIAMDWLANFSTDLVTGGDIADDIRGFLTTFVTPFGGKQLERLIDGFVQAGWLPDVDISLSEGISIERQKAPGVYDNKDQLRFPVPTLADDPWGALRAIVFGAYTTEYGEKYLGKDRKNSKWWENILGWNKVKEQTALSPRATAVYNALVAGGADQFGIYDTLLKVKAEKKSIGKRNALLDALAEGVITEEDALNILLGYMTDKNNVESVNKKITAFTDVGLTVTDYLEVSNLYSMIENNTEYEGAQDRANAFVTELVNAGYSADEINSINNTMKYYSHIPANIDDFVEMTASGLDAKLASEVQNVLAALEPLPGEKQVSDLQNAEAIAGMKLDPDDELAAMALALPKETYVKYEVVTDYGVSAQVWVDYQNALADANANNPDESKRNKNYDNEEKQTALNSMNVSNETRAALWQISDNQLYRKDKDASWKAGRNPYNSSVGSQVVDACVEGKTALDASKEADESQGSYGSPLTGDLVINSKYGYRVHPISGKYKMHTGIDLDGEQGDPVLAAADGKVVKVVHSNTGYGNHVIIEHEDGTQTLYAHMYSYGVEEGQDVLKGEQIGEVGSTGASTGNHLHFEVRVDGQHVNPQTVFDFTGDGIVESADSSNYTPIVSGGGSYGGYSSGGGSSSGSRSGGGYASSGTSRVASVRTSNQGGMNNSGNIVLPRAGGSSGGGSAPVTGRSTKAPTYAAKGLTLPKASDYSRGTQRNIGATSVATTQRTGRTGGSLWDPDVI